MHPMFLQCNFMLTLRYNSDGWTGDWNIQISNTNVLGLFENRKFANANKNTNKYHDKLNTK